MKVIKSFKVEKMRNVLNIDICQPLWSKITQIAILI